jgi:hypothetical protein
MSSTFKAWLKGATERAVKTAAQVFASLLTAGQVGVLDFDWKTAGSLVLMSVIASITTSLANIDFVAGKPKPGDDGGN